MKALLPLVTASAIALFGPAAEAQIHAAPPVMNLSEAACVATLGNRCILKTAHRSVEMVLLQDEGLVAVLKRGAESDSVAVQQDLADRVAKEELTPDDALVVASELASYDGAAYALPTVEELKQTLGFPVEAELNRDDLRDLMRAHLQLTLGVGPLTATYLYDRLGVESADEVLPGVIEATASLDLPAAKSTAQGTILDDAGDDEASGLIKPNRN